MQPLNTREFSSAGSEHLPYKQRVTGSNPVTPTNEKKPFERKAFFIKINLHFFLQYFFSLVDKNSHRLITKSISHFATHGLIKNIQF